MLPHLKNRFQNVQQENANAYPGTKPGENKSNPVTKEYSSNQMTSESSSIAKYGAINNYDLANNLNDKVTSQPSTVNQSNMSGYNDTATTTTSTKTASTTTRNEQVSKSTRPTTQQDQNPNRKSKNNKIDPDKIPRPDIEPQTSYDPKKYQTSLKVNPPTTFTNYITVDDGNAGPRYIRSSFYKVPTESSILASTHIPFGVILQPLADPSPFEEAVQIVDYGEFGPLRCTRCRGYVNPYWAFIDGGNIGICNLCKMNNQVTREYYSPLDEYGIRKDRLEKPELSKGVYEFIAPNDYHTRALVIPHIILCLDVSSASFINGIFQQMLSSLQSLLDYIPSPELTKIAILTYDSHVNFFKVPDSSDKDIQVIQICDLDDPCIPFPKEQYFLRLIEDRDKIDLLIQRILKYYENYEKLSKGIYATCFGAALNNCMGLLLEQGGRCIISTTQAPIQGIGKIKRRDDYKIYGTDKEKALYAPQIEDYERIGKFCLEKRIGVDMFVFAQEYFDLTTIGQVSNITGGSIYYYPTYNSTFDGEKLHYDLARNLTRYLAYDAVMKIRTSQSISCQEYITPAGRRPSSDFEFSILDSDTALNVYLKLDDKITDSDAYIQAAILYTNQYGQRVIRVINLALGTTNDLVTIFRCNDVEVTTQLLLRKNFLNLSNNFIKSIRESIISQVVNILHAYRFNCASNSSPAQLILPESLKLLPLYAFSALKMNILRLGQDIRPDERTYDLYRLTKAPVNVMSSLLYLKIFPLHTIHKGDQNTPGNTIADHVILGPSLPVSEDKLDSDGIYLLDNNDTIYIYVKADADCQILEDLFGVDSINDVATLQSFPTNLQTDFSIRVNNIIDQLRKNKNGAYQPVRIVTEKDPLEPYLLNLLIEDETKFGEAYSDFLCNIHKLIQQKMS